MAVGGLSERLAFVLEMDPSNAIAGMRRVGTEADRHLGNVDDRLNRIGGRMQTAGAGAVAFAGVAGAALMGFARASEEAAAESRKLDQAMATNASFAQEGRESFDDLAASLQDLTGADGDAITGMLGFLGTLGQTADEAQRAAPLIVDLAKRFGLELEPAARLVNNAIEGNASRLERLIGPIGDNENAIDALARTVGGFAEREAQTFSGQLEIMKQNLGDVAEGIGGGVIGAFNNMLGPVMSAAEAFTELDAGTQETVGTFAAYGTAAVGAVGASSFLIGSILKMADNFKTAREAVSGFVGRGGLGRVAMVAGPAVAALGLFAVAMQNQASKAAEAEGRIDSLASSIRESGSIAEATTAAFERGELFEGLGISASEFTSHLADLGIGLEDLQAAWDGNAATANTFTETLRAARAEGRITSEEYDRLGVAFGDLSTRIHAANDEAGAQAEVLGEVAGATDEVSEATAESTAAIEENRKALEARTEALLAARGHELSLAEAMLGTAEELDTYNEVMADGEATDRDRLQAGIDLEQQFYNEAEAAGRLAEAEAVAQGAAVDSAEAQAASAQAQIETLNRLLANIGPDSPLRAGILSHIAALRSIPTDIETRISTTNWLYGSGFLKQGGYGPSGVMAAGGIVDTPITRINERGVEMYTDAAGHDYLLGGQGGTVTPNHRLGGAAPMSLTFNIGTDVDAMSARRAARELENVVRNLNWSL